MLTLRVRNLYNQKNSLLLRLPPELRNKIYAYVSNSMVFDRKDTGGRVLRSVCGQVTAEALPFIQTSGYLCVQTQDSWDAFKVLSRWALGDTASYHTIEMPICLALDMCDEIDNARYGETRGPWCHPFPGLAARFLGIREVVAVDDRAGGGLLAGEEKERFRSALATMLGGLGLGVDSG